jgi:hypothetical protein
MTLREAQTVLARIAEHTPNQQSLPEVQRQLGECLSVLRQETSFKAIPPGAPAPMMRYEIVEAQDSVENAIKALEQNDGAEMLKHVQNAASQLLGMR